MKIVFGLIVAAGMIAPAQAAWRAGTPIANGTAVERIADGCGPGFFRGDGGHCRPIRDERWREERREEHGRDEHWREDRWRDDRWREERWRERAGDVCPRGYHYVPRDGRCWVNW